MSSTQVRVLISRTEQAEVMWVAYSDKFLTAFLSELQAIHYCYVFIALYFYLTQHDILSACSSMSSQPFLPFI